MQTFAIIPAAGRSRRMGQPKLLLPWNDSTVIEQMIAVWRASSVDRVLAVVHPEDSQLAALAEAAGAELVRPTTPPPDMKASVGYGLEAVGRYRPGPDDAWLLAPADMPTLKSTTIDAVLDAYRAAVTQGGDVPAVIVPRARGKRGHPVLFSWSLAAEVARLAEDEGLNALIDRFSTQFIEVAPDAICQDFDTPGDYQRVRERYTR